MATNTASSNGVLLLKWEGTPRHSEHAFLFRALGGRADAPSSPAATVSHHLKILSEAGLIACRREGQFVYSQTVPETIAAYAQALAKIARGKKAARCR